VKAKILFASPKSRSSWTSRKACLPFVYRNSISQERIDSKTRNFSRSRAKSGYSLWYSFLIAAVRFQREIGSETELTPRKRLCVGSVSASWRPSIFASVHALGTSKETAPGAASSWRVRPRDAAGAPGTAGRAASPAGRRSVKRRMLRVGKRTSPPATRTTVNLPSSSRKSPSIREPLRSSTTTGRGVVPTAGCARNVKPRRRMECTGPLQELRPDARAGRGAVSVRGRQV
jgi:hypothetical protein